MASFMKKREASPKSLPPRSPQAIWAAAQSVRSDWLLNQQTHLSKAEQAAMQRLERLVAQGQIQLGCRVGPHWQQPRQVLNE
jgi:hypothetical protein